MPKFKFLNDPTHTCSPTQGCPQCWPAPVMPPPSNSRRCCAFNYQGEDYECYLPGVESLLAPTKSGGGSGSKKLRRDAAETTITPRPRGSQRVRVKSGDAERAKGVSAKRKTRKPKTPKRKSMPRRKAR
jgi:hypothetical protein